MFQTLANPQEIHFTRMQERDRIPHGPGAPTYHLFIDTLDKLEYAAIHRLWFFVCRAFIFALNTGISQR
jgi:hypothetical protein